MTLTVPAAENVWTYKRRTLTDHEFDITYPLNNLGGYIISDTDWHSESEGVPTLDPLKMYNVAKPSGSTIKRETLLIVISAMNRSATLQRINVEVYPRKVPGSWGAALFSRSPYLSLINVDAARVSDVIIADATGLVKTGGDGDYEFRIRIKQSAAAQVEYFYAGVYVITYEME